MLCPSSSKVHLGWTEDIAILLGGGHIRHIAGALQVMDYGYPQFTEAQILQEFIKTDSYKMEVCTQQLRRLQPLSSCCSSAQLANRRPSSTAQLSVCVVQPSNENAYSEQHGPGVCVLNTAALSQHRSTASASSLAGWPLAMSKCQSSSLPSQ